MIKNVEYVISVFDIIKLLRWKWKVVCIIVLVCALFCGGYAAFHKVDTVDPRSYEIYETDKTYYDYLEGTKQEFKDSLKSEWKNICFDRVNNPVFSVDPYACEYEQIVICFEDNSNHDATVNNWILAADNVDLFGNQNTLSDYKTSLVVEPNLILQEKGTIPNSETVVQIIAVNGFDTDNAANYLINHFRKCAEKEEVRLGEISRSSNNGYNEYVDNYQQNNREKYVSVYTAIADSKTMDSFITAPINPQDDQSGSLMNIIKYCLLGLIVGFMLSVAFIIICVFYKHEIISARQVEKAFDLELLSDCSLDEESAIDVLNANLDVMTSENSTIAIITDNLVKDNGRDFSRWADNSDRVFIECSDMFDNPAMIEALRKADGIVVGVKLGKSKLEQIQRVVLRANKLNLKVLGFVLV